MPEYIILGVSVLILIIAIIILLKVNRKGENEELSKKLSDLQKNIADEFSRSRLDTNQFQQGLKEETARTLQQTGERINEMTKSNYENSLKMTEAMNQSLNAIKNSNIELNEKQTKKIEEAIEKMQESNEKKLDQMRETVDEKLNKTLATRLDSSFKTVSEQLENLYKSLGEMKQLSSGVTENVSSLNRMLSNVKSRGTWAEVQLEGILDQTIPGMYDKNVATSGTADRVEFAVRIPSSDNKDEFVYLPIDSKFPTEDYIRLCEAADRADAEATEAARKALEARVLGEAKTITKYINIPKTTPFAIMYLATEGLYAEIVSSKTGLPEKLHNELNVMIAGPTTITALLNSLSLGFRTVAINEKANEIRELLGITKSQYEKFGVLLDKAKKKIDEAGRTIDEASHRSGIIQKKLRSVEAIESSDFQALSEPDSVDDIEQ
ncbi:MAG: DNA recombination protein RmuC [Clostridiales bacterium]|nr:DNA recombination protein RmuC [Clostridiales bacterium]